MQLQNKQANKVYRRPESVLVVVYTAEQNVLLLERCHPAGYWQSVTGSLEPSENAKHCAIRELSEETGISATPIDTGIVNQFEIMPQWRDRYAPTVKQNTEYVFSLLLEEMIEPVLSVKEHRQFEWLDAQEAIEKCFSHTNAEAIARIVLSS